MKKMKLIFIVSVIILVVNVADTIGQDNDVDITPSAQKNIENQINKIENQLKSINTSFINISHDLNKTKTDLNTSLSLEISSVTKQIDSAQKDIASLSQEFDANKKYISNVLVTAMSPDWTQIGMFWFSIILVLITVMATYINYRLYRLQTDPDVIVYSMPDPNRTTIINLIIENIGKGVAKNIQFSSDKPIPCRAFGMGDNAPVPQEMNSGPLIAGIPELGPNSKRVITWGQYHGLLKGLGDEILTITADYSARKTFLKTPRYKSTFSLDIKSFEGTDASDQNWDKKSAESLVKIAQSLKNIASSINRNP